MFTGGFTHLLEEHLGKLFPGHHSLALNSGTAALHVALACTGVQPEDEVIVPAVSYAATALAPLYVGARPVFADVDARTLTLAPESCERVISPRTRAVIFVHLFGTSGTLDDIIRLCNRHGLRLIQDCAQSLGTEQSGHLVGGEGDAACFSFFETKTVSAGEGGAVLLRDKGSLEKGRRLRHHGMDVAGGSRAVELVGHNYKMCELQAAVTLAQLCKLERIAGLRREFAAIVRSALGPAVSFQETPRREATCWDKICLLFPDHESRERAEELAEPLKVRPYLSRPLCDEPVFEGCRSDPRLRACRRFCDNHLVVQCSPVFEKRDLHRACTQFAARLAKRSNTRPSDP